MTIPRRIILQQEEEVEEELALMNQGTLNLDQNLEKKKTAETSVSSPLHKTSAAAIQSTEEQIQNPLNRSVRDWIYRFTKPINFSFGGTNQIIHN